MGTLRFFARENNDLLAASSFPRALPLYVLSAIHGYGLALAFDPASIFLTICMPKGSAVYQGMSHVAQCHRVCNCPMVLNHVLLHVASDGLFS